MRVAGHPTRIAAAALAIAVVAAGCGTPEMPSAPSASRPSASAGTARPAADPTAAADASTFGPWRRRPVAATLAIAQASESACRAQPGVGSTPLTLLDNRGAAVLTLVFTDRKAAFVCHVAMTVDGVATADARALPDVVAGPAPGEGKLGPYDLEVIPAPSGPRVVIVGRVSDVPEVSVNFDDATWGRMAMSAGWYTGWWPQAAVALAVATVDRRNTVITSFALP